MVPVVLYGCETWYLTLREEHRQRVIEKRVLRKLFRPERNRVTGDRRRIHNEELHDLYSSPDIVRVSRSRGDRGGTVVKVLRYKSEGRWFDPSWCHWNFSLT